MELQLFAQLLPHRKVGEANGNSPDQGTEQKVLHARRVQPFF